MKLTAAAAILLSTPSILAWSLPWSKPAITTRNQYEDLLVELEKRDGVGIEIDSTCGNGSTAQMFQHFNGIFFGDFITSTPQGIDGPLAVGGRFQGDTYTVNQDGSPVCSSEESFQADGLIVAGEFDGVNIHVFGDTYLSNGSTASDVEQETSGCSVYTDRSTGGFDFGKILTDSNVIQVLYAPRHPTLVIDSNFNMTRVQDAVGGIDVITFNTCDGGCTSLYPDYLSDPSGMLFGENNWNGPQGMSFPENLIINIPVTQGSTLNLAGNDISSGLYGCSTLWNVFPTSGSGYYGTGATITVFRETGGRLDGMFLAPLADIIDGPTASFAGQVIGSSYSWSSSGVFIDDFGSCSFSMCFPIIIINLGDNSSDSSSIDSSSDSSDSDSSSDSSSDSVSSDSSSSDSSDSSESSSDSESSDSSSSDSSSSESESDSSSSDSSESSDTSSSSESDSSSSESESDSSSSESESSSSESDSSSSESESSSSESESESSLSESESESSSSSVESDCDSSSGVPPTICTTEYHQHHHHKTQLPCDEGEDDYHEFVYCEYDNHMHEDSEGCEIEEIVVCRDNEDFVGDDQEHERKYKHKGYGYDKYNDDNEDDDDYDDEDCDEEYKK